jgi:hypothetical protein
LSFRARVVLAAGWIAFLLYAYPGFMSFDSAVQLREARAGHYSDWHPPVMAFIWRYLDMVVAGPLLMLLLQSGLLLFGSYALLRRVARPTYAACGAAGILLFPPIATAMAVIWKDSLMVGAVVAGLALVLAESRRRRIAGLALFALAAAVRYNGFTITLVPMIALFRWNDATGALRRYAVATIAWLATVGCAQLANRALVDEPMHPWHGSVAMFDIVGTIRFSPPLDDDTLAEALRGTPLLVAHDFQREARAAYDPTAGVFRIIDTFMKQPTDAEQRDAVARAWWQLVSAHPTAYLEHRWQVFERVLSLQREAEPWIWTGIDGTGADLVQLTPTRFQNKLMRAAHRFATSWLMRVWVYLLSSLVVGAIAIAMRDRVAIAIVVSAISAELVLLIAAPTDDFRYSLWLVVAALLATFHVVATRLLRARPALGMRAHAEHVLGDARPHEIAGARRLADVALEDLHAAREIAGRDHADPIGRALGRGEPAERGGHRHDAALA